MSDIVEDVAKAIYPLDPNTSGEWGIGYTEWEDSFRDQAEAAIAAAEPHLRRKHRQELLDELIAASDGMHPIACYEGSGKEGFFLASWLEERKEAE